MGVSGGVPGFFSHALGVRGLLNLKCQSSCRIEKTMGLRTTIRNRWWCGGCAAVLCWAIVLGCAVQELAAKTVTHRKVELTPWEQAERGLEAL